MQERWSAVDAYIADRLIAAVPVLDAALARNASADLPAQDVSPPQGKLLHLVALMIGARRVLELGTLGGYSTIWLARALPPGGLIVTLEADVRHAAVARANIAAAGMSDRVDLRVGRALELLPGLEAMAMSRSTSSSSTPTSRTTRTTSIGRSASRARAR